MFITKFFDTLHRQHYLLPPQEDDSETASDSTSVLAEALEVLDVGEAILLIPTLVIVIAIPLIGWFLFRKKMAKETLSFRTIMFWILFWMASLFLGVWAALRPTGLHFIAICVFVGWLFRELRKDSGNGGKASNESFSEEDD